MDKDNSNTELREKLQGFVKQWVEPQMQGRVIPDELLQCIHDEQYITQHCCMVTKLDTQPLCAMKDIQHIRNRITGMVISPLDKNGGMVNIMCKKRWHRLYESVFTDAQLYKPISHGMQTEIQRQYRAYTEKGLDTVAPWNDKGELPESYFLTKDKNLEKQRPVVTAWNHPPKQTLKVCAKGGTMLLKSAEKLKHFGITSTNQVW